MSRGHMVPPYRNAPPEVCDTREEQREYERQMERAREDQYRDYDPRDYD